MPQLLQIYKNWAGERGCVSHAQALPGGIGWMDAHGMGLSDRGNCPAPHSLTDWHPCVRVVKGFDPPGPAAL